MQYFFGKNAVIEAIKSEKINTVYCIKLLNELKPYVNKIKIHIVKPTFFNKFKNNHQFVIGVNNILNNNYKNTDFDIFFKKIIDSKNKRKIILILDEILDPHNFGAICRNALAFGVEGIIYKKNNQVQVNDTVIKTSLGAINYLNFLVVNNISNVIKKLKNLNFWSFVTSLDDDSIQLSKLSIQIDNILLIVGNEHKGVSKIIQNNADFLIKIEINKQMQSLNVATSTGILLYYFRSIY